MGIIHATSGNLVATYEYDAWGNCTVTDISSTNVGTSNPFRYRGYYYDADMGLYYLNSRYYDAETGRFISGDKYASTGQGVLGSNMFTYCLNNPINFVDKKGDNAEAVRWWTGAMWWLCSVDAVLPIGDIIYAAGILVLGTVALVVTEEVSPPRVSFEKEKEKDEPDPPVPYPGDDPSKAPEGTEWKGKKPQGGREGNYYNPKNKTSLHPDLDHPEPVGPHWDYKDSTGKWWRIYKNGIIEPKL